jgi:hypothetical protein
MEEISPATHQMPIWDINPHDPIPINIPPSNGQLKPKK